MTSEPASTGEGADAPEDRHEAPPVVGIGASAGGLEALQKLLSHVPAGTGLVFVVVQHLDPTHPSMLVELLAQHTAMRVAEAADGVRPEPDRVYIIAPSTLLTLEQGVMRVIPEVAASAPIDVFFRSLAMDRGERAIGVILSGFGQDGTAGLRAIKERGGVTFAQSPESAKHNSMPQSAIGAGLVDHVLPVEALPAKILEHVGYVRGNQRDGAEALEAQLLLNLPRICSLIHQRTGHDFSRYKEGTLLRRIRRRLQVQHVGSVREYLEYLETDAGEAEGLLKDLLIGVTNFFRDPEAFQVLASQVLPRMIQGKPTEASIRIWVPGCASGEEVYTLAILVREQLERLGRRFVQIFATDLDPEMLEQARHARYPTEIAEHVSAERLARFFVRDGQSYQPVKDLREMCIFSQHSLIRDPPFSSLDLISCRNVLIYMSAELQKKLVPIFHYALRPGGHLFLGPSESLTSFPELFEVVDKRHRIYRRKETVTRPLVEFPLSNRWARDSMTQRQPDQGQPPPQTPREKLGAAFERVVLEEYSSPSMVVNDGGDILLLAGPVARFLQLPTGAPTSNLLESLRGPLRAEVRSALRAAAQSGRRVVRDHVAVDLEGSTRHLRLTVRPMPWAEPGASLFLIVLQEQAAAETSGGEEVSAAPIEQPAIEHLENELRSTRAELKSTVEEVESANEELKSSNEELISTNEELQSANEEMQTSKEELQSLNEELETVNSELRQKVEELGEANSDLQNLFASTQLATLFLNRDLKIVKFTSAATGLFRFIDGDVGRPLSDLSPRFVGDNLVADAREVLRSLAPVQRQVMSAEGGSWFIYRALPYRTVDNVIAGVVVTFVDVSELKRAEEALRQSQELLRAVCETTPDPVFVKDTESRLLLANPATLTAIGKAAEDVLGRSDRELYDDPAVGAAVVATDRRVIESGVPETVEETLPTRQGNRVFLSTKAPYRNSQGKIAGLVGISHDITERKQMEEELRRAHERAAWVARFPEENPDPVLRLSAESTLLYANAAAIANMGDLRLAPGKPAPPALAEPASRALAAGQRVRHELALGNRCFSLGFSPVGSEVNIYGHDITERKQAEDALARSRQGLRRLAEASLRVMRETDLQGMLEAISGAALALTATRIATTGHGYVSGQFVVGGSARGPDAPACPPGDMFVQEKGGIHTALMEGAESIRLTDEQLRADSRWWGLPNDHVPLRGLLGARMVARNGQTNGMILVTDKEHGELTAEDESLLCQLATVASLALQHVEARISLEESDRHKNQFLAMLSHELRNPLAPIGNSLFVLERAQPGSEQAKRAQAVIARQAAHMTRLVDDLLDITRVSSGRVQLQRELLDLAELVRRAAEDHRSSFALNGVDLDVAIPDEPVRIDGDRTRIAQVVGNLLQNSVKFTPAGGRATISVEENAALHDAVVRVRDTGVGISQEMLPRVFEPFTQADTTLDRSKGGLGLGLALVKGLVEMHGGIVSVASEGLGKGAEFTLRLPLQPAPPKRTARERGASRGPSRRVLIIEDNRDAAESLRDVLELGEHTVEVAFSGASGIEKTRAFKPDVVLCDIGLPGMDGYEVARALRADPELRNVFLVALSGYALPEEVAKGRAAGFDRHLPKPPELTALAQVLAESCADP